jgi:hypothetical protein
METTKASRIFIQNVSEFMSGEVCVKGWVYRLRVLAQVRHERGQD